MSAMHISNLIVRYKTTGYIVAYKNYVNVYSPDSLIDHVDGCDVEVGGGLFPPGPAQALFDAWQSLAMWEG